MNAIHSDIAPPRRNRRWLIAGAAAIALLAGAGATTAWAERGHDNRHGGGWSMEHGMSTDRIERRADHMLKKVDATAEQKAKIHAIIEAAAKDIDPIRKSMAGSRAEFRDLLTAPQIDRAAVEALRVKRTAAMDQISQRMTLAMTDAAEVLTQAQRQKIATMQAERQEKRGEHKGEHKGDHKGGRMGEPNKN